MFKLGFPRNKPITKFNQKQRRAFVKRLQEQWDFTPDFTLDEQCFFIADFLMPENAETCSPKVFKKWVKFAFKHTMISDEQFVELFNNAEYYFQEVLSKRQIRNIPESSEAHTNLSLFFTAMFLLNIFSGPLYQVLHKSLKDIPKLNTTVTQDSPEPSIFSYVDRFVGALLFFMPLLSLPTANAMGLSSKSHIVKEFPELARGTHKHGSLSEAMTTGMLSICEAMAPALQQPYENLIFLVGESHGECFFQEFWIQSCLAIYLAQQPKSIQESISVSFVLEADASSVEIKSLKNLREALLSLHLGDMRAVLQYGYKSIREAFLASLQIYCLNHPTSKGLLMGTCAMLGANIYGFDTTIASTKIHLKSRQDIESPFYSRFSQIIIADAKEQRNIPMQSAPPEVLSITDNSLATEIQKNLNKSGKTITVAIMGANHLQGTVELVEDDANTVVPLNLATMPGTREVHDAYLAIANRCIKPADECPTESLKQNSEIFTHCALDQDYDSTKCDAPMHKKVKEEAERIRFAYGEAVKQIPYVDVGLPNNPNAFFPPAKAIGKAKKLFSQEIQKSGYRRNEL